MSPLLNCPFCGGEAEIVQIGNEATRSRGFEVRCLTWGCSTKKRAMVIRHSLDQARSYAIAAWNRRAPPEQSAPAPCPACLGEAEGCGVCNERGTAWGSATVLVRVGDATYRFAVPPEQSAAGHPVAVDGGKSARERAEGDAERTP